MGFLEAFSILYGGLAHLGERLLCTQEVTSSSLVSSTIKTFILNMRL